jgi:hypothetical protein
MRTHPCRSGHELRESEHLRQPSQLLNKRITICIRPDKLIHQKISHDNCPEVGITLAQRGLTDETRVRPTRDRPAQTVMVPFETASMCSWGVPRRPPATMSPGWRLAFKFKSLRACHDADIGGNFSSTRSGTSPSRQHVVSGQSNCRLQSGVGSVPALSCPIPTGRDTDRMSFGGSSTPTLRSGGR